MSPLYILSLEVCFNLRLRRVVSFRGEIAERIYIIIDLLSERSVGGVAL